ncbi:MAG: hypothetical protein ACLTC4_08935 [Hungatella hathewayi]
MNRHEILLRTQNDIVNFVNKIAISFSVPIYCVEAMWWMPNPFRVLGFGMGKVLTLQVYGDDSKDADVRHLRISGCKVSVDDKN